MTSKFMKCSIFFSHKVIMEIKHSIGNVVNDTVMTMLGATWVLDLPGNHSVNYVNV